MTDRPKGPMDYEDGEPWSQATWLFFFLVFPLAFLMRLLLS